MTDPYRRERIEHWVGDFLESDRARAFSPEARDVAPGVLVAFLEAACTVRDVGPDEIEEQDLKPALLDSVGGLEIPLAVRGDVPGLVRAFLEEMETQGRLGGGRALGLVVGALARPYKDRASGKGETIHSPASKLGRNDPCPCGSGLKYKRCCMGRLG